MNHEEISTITGLSPTRTYMVGTLLRNNLTAIDSVWMYASQEQTDFSFDSLFASFVNDINRNAYVLKEYLEVNRLNSKFNLVVKYRNDTFPSIYLTNEFISICHILNAEVDIDVQI